MLCLRLNRLEKVLTGLITFIFLTLKTKRAPLYAANGTNQPNDDNNSNVCYYCLFTHSTTHGVSLRHLSHVMPNTALQGDIPRGLLKRRTAKLREYGHRFFFLILCTFRLHAKEQTFSSAVGRDVNVGIHSSET